MHALAVPDVDLEAGAGKHLRNTGPLSTVRHARARTPQQPGAHPRVSQTHSPHAHDADFGFRARGAGGGGDREAHEQPEQGASTPRRQAARPPLAAAETLAFAACGWRP